MSRARVRLLLKRPPGALTPADHRRLIGPEVTPYPDEWDSPPTFSDGLKLGALFASAVVIGMAGTALVLAFLY